MDLEHLESLIDSRTRGIYVVNPSNPCSSVWTREHQEKIVAIANKYKLPILADEVYFGIVYPGREFIPFGQIDKDTPIIVTQSIIIHSFFRVSTPCRRLACCLGGAQGG